jgi:hypothetical protein
MEGTTQMIHQPITAIAAARMHHAAGMAINKRHDTNDTQATEGTPE